MQGFAEPEVRALYAAFNARDIDTALASMAHDVDWPNGMEGGRVQGTEAVRAYWTRQWRLIDPSVTPVRVDDDAEGRVRVVVQQVVRDLAGGLLGEGMVVHRYTLDAAGQVARMDILDPPTPQQLISSP